MLSKKDAANRQVGMKRHSLQGSQSCDSACTDTCDREQTNILSASKASVPTGADWVLQTLIRQKVFAQYKFPEQAQHRIDEAIQDYSATCLVTHGVQAVCDENVQTFINAIEQVFGADMNLQSECSNSECSKCSALESVSSGPKTRRVSDESMSSVHTSDSDVTKSTKKVVKWKKSTRDNTPSSLPPGVLWRKSSFNPSSIDEHGLSAIQEHVIEDHIRAFETALDEHEVQLVNEMRVMKGKSPISEKSCVIVNNCVYVTGGPAIFACVMETYDDEKSVHIFIHVNTTTSRFSECDAHRHKTFVVECSKTGACFMRCPIASMRFWKELGTATLCMLPADGSKRHMAPTTYFHLESVSHCRLFAKELSRR